MTPMQRLSLMIVLGGCLTASSSLAQVSHPGFPDFAWTRSLGVHSQSDTIGILGGTEARSLVAMDGKLYAGIGYWSAAEEKNPRLPGAQVLVLDAPDSAWKVDLQLDDLVASGPKKGAKSYMAISALQSVTFQRDKSGHSISPVGFLLAGVWKRDEAGGTEIFTRASTSQKWKKTLLGKGPKAPREPVRAFFLYQDSVTGIERVIAGTTVPDRDLLGGIYSGAYDSGAGEIEWDPTPEAWVDHPDTSQTPAQTRVASFAKGNGKLYAAVYDSLYERQDGWTPSWKRVFQQKLNVNNKGGTGFRGLTTIQNRSGRGEVLLVAKEDRPLLILKVNPQAKFSVSVDLDVSEFLSRAWSTRVGYGIGAYNDMLGYPDPSDPGGPALLIGFEAVTPQRDTGFKRHFETGAHFIVRHADGRYELRDIVDPKFPNAVLVATRTLIRSPFAADPEGTLYAGGFDANYEPVHNTAWIYKGTPGH